MVLPMSDRPAVFVCVCVCALIDVWRPFDIYMCKKYVKLTNIHNYYIRDYTAIWYIA